MNRHPDVLLPLHREPHRKFVERIQRDYLVHGFVHFYEVGEIRTRNEQIAQRSGLSKNAEDLLRVVMIDQPAAASSESQVMDTLHAFFIALEYLNIYVSSRWQLARSSTWPSSRNGDMRIAALLCCSLLMLSFARKYIG